MGDQIEFAKHYRNPIKMVFTFIHSLINQNKHV